MHWLPEVGTPQAKLPEAGQARNTQNSFLQPVHKVAPIVIVALWHWSTPASQRNPLWLWTAFRYVQEKATDDVGHVRWFAFQKQLGCPVGFFDQSLLRPCAWVPRFRHAPGQAAWDGTCKKYAELKLQKSREQELVHHSHARTSVMQCGDRVDSSILHDCRILVHLAPLPA